MTPEQRGVRSVVSRKSEVWNWLHCIERKNNWITDISARPHSGRVASTVQSHQKGLRFTAFNPCELEIDAIMDGLTLLQVLV